MATLIIKQIRSGIGRPEVQKRNLLALGLKINKSVEVEGTPQILGMIEKVKHLVQVTQK